MRPSSALIVLGIIIAALALPLMAGLARPQAADPAHDRALTDLVGIYESLADSILANKRSEENVVRAIVELQRGLALAALDRAAADPGALRAAADHIATFATEGGAAVEPVRNRLLAGGHHHHADDSGSDAAYDSGYVVLDKGEKKRALDLSKRCARLAASGGTPDAAAVTSIRDELMGIAPARAKR